MAYIYKITNLINGKSYIGQTSLSIENRWKQHWNCLNKPECVNRPLYRAFFKYGKENFKIESIEECSDEELNDREQFWIDYYDTYNSGYNLTIGGDGSRHYQKEKILKLWLQGKSVGEISKELNCYRNGVALVLDYYKIPISERLKRGYYREGKPVAQIDKNTNEIIAIFPTMTNAAKFLNKNVDTASEGIRRVCKGTRKTAYGYKWKWV